MENYLADTRDSLYLYTLNFLWKPKLENLNFTQANDLLQDDR